VATAAGIMILYAKSQMEKEMDRVDQEQVKDIQRIKLPLPPLEVEDAGSFDYTWLPRTIDGSAVKFGDMRDRLMLINIWHTQCRPCLKEMPEFASLYDWIEQENLPIDLFLVSTDPEETLKWFLEENSLSPPVIIAHEELPACLWSRGVPLTVIVRPGGQICYRHLGAGTWAAPEVKQFLKGLLADDQEAGAPL